MTLFRLDSSIRQADSVSRAVASSYENAWRAVHPAGTVIERDLVAEPIPADAWPLAVFGGRLSEDDRSPEQAKAVALAKTLADEVFAADSYVFATALYNFGVSQYVKSWVDLLITDPRLAAGVEKPLAGRSATLVIARGGGYGEGTPREGWDHAIGWLKRIFVDVWGLDLEIIEAELTLAPVVPAMAELVDLAAQLEQSAHQAALARGTDVGQLARAIA